MVEKQLKDIKITDLQDKFLNITLTSNSKDVYNHGVEPLLIAIKDNSAEAAATEATSVTSAYLVPTNDSEAIKNPAEKGTLMASIYTFSDAKKNMVKYMVGTDVHNTYLQPTNAKGDIFRGIKEDKWVSTDAGIPLVQAIVESLRSVREIATFNPSFELMNTQEVINSITDAPASVTSGPQVPKTAAKSTASTTSTDSKDTSADK